MTLALKKTQPETKPDKKKLSIFLAGIGAVGGTLLEQIRDLEHPRYDLEIVGFCNSRFTCWEPDAEQLNDPTNICCGAKTDWDSIPKKILDKADHDLVFVDATGSENVARVYHDLLQHGIHIATPSKLANTFEQEYFDALDKICIEHNSHYRYETAVGAGLPVVSTIKTLLNSGDEITKIAGVVSGTMTYLFNQLEAGVSFSQSVQNAKTNGYSEPDPRDDLSGEDVARKFLILARISGFEFDREQIRVDSLVPEKLVSLSTDEFLQKLPDYDSHWKSRNAQALVNNKKLRYVGEFTPDGISVGVSEVKADSPLSHLKGTDNLIQIYTRRYSDSPIVIQGPGAGKEVTAAGVLGDIIDIGGLV